LADADFELEDAGLTENNQAGNHRKKKIILIVVGLIVVLGIGSYLWGRGKETTDDAFVDGRIYSVTPRVPGYVTEVLVEDNQKIEQGQTLVKLDASDYEVEVAAAKAALAESEATLTSLELGVPLELSQTEQRVRAATAQLESMKQSLEAASQEEDAAAQELHRVQAEYQRALLDLRRMQTLKKSGAISQSAYDNIQTQVKTTAALVGAAEARRDRAANQWASIKSDISRLEANIDLAATGEEQATIRSRQVEAQKARVELARTRVEQAELNLDYTVLKSPASGFVTRKSVEPGVMVSRGQPLMAVVPGSKEDIWITANYKETQLTDVRPGQKVKIKVDAFPGVKLEGIVESIMAGTGSVFSLFPPENASGNYVKVVQRIPVRITISNNPGDTPRLRIGMSVVPTIYTSD
jgi:membrane fusion protein (multidrug efflux system)